MCLYLISFKSYTPPKYAEIPPSITQYPEDYEFYSLDWTRYFTLFLSQVKNIAFEF